MPATSVDRNTRRRGGDWRSVPVAANTAIPAGCIAALDAAGYLVNAGTAGATRVVGHTQSGVNNAGVAGAAHQPVWKGVAGPFVNSSGGDLITMADVGATAYAVDNQTVAKLGTDGRLAAGEIWEVADGGIWIKFV